MCKGIFEAERIPFRHVHTLVNNKHQTVHLNLSFDMKFHQNMSFVSFKNGLSGIVIKVF